MLWLKEKMDRIGWHPQLSADIARELLTGETSASADSGTKTLEAKGRKERLMKKIRKEQEKQKPLSRSHE